MPRSVLSRADGVVIQFQYIVLVIDHHPVRSIKGGFAPFFLLSRPPLLEEEGKSSYLANVWFRSQTRNSTSGTCTTNCNIE